jgi:hypothetical protein
VPLDKDDRTETRPRVSLRIRRLPIGAFSPENLTKTRSSSASLNFSEPTLRWSTYRQSVLQTTVPASHHS